MNYTTEDVRQCKIYLSQYGSNYKYAVCLLPRDVRDATTILYAFVRYADELIDNPTSDTPETDLENWIASWRKAYHEQICDDPILGAMYRMCTSYDIPYDYTHDFLTSMKQDISVSRYETYTDLEQYMWGSASVVGLIMSQIIGVSEDTEYKDSAIALGEAMQLTNFIRDISEDFHDRNRVYIPQEWLRDFEVDETWIRDKQMTPQSRELIIMMCDKAHALFQKGNAGIDFLDPSGQSAVLLSSRIYENILHKIKKNNYDVFASNLNNSFFDIARIGISHILHI